MISTKKAFVLLFLISISTLFAQLKPESKKITITGKLIEKTTSLPLEYATITFRKPNTTQAVSGGITDNKGAFSIEINAGTYDVRYEYISFKTIELKNQTFNSNTNLGTISLEDDAQKLDAVEIRGEKTTVDIKLDKKVYNVGKDILVRGGTVSDVLDNVPSVAVSAEGTVSLRGNENVRILIDGKPSSAINVSDALRLVSADAIDKVEVVTNPSARYDAEGGGGIINIILKKGKNQGLNGTFIVSAGEPENSSASANINLKSEQFNLFTTIGYNKRKTPGNTKIDQENLNPDGSLKSYLEERRDSKRFGQGVNVNFGIELFLDKQTSWTNALSYRQNKGGNKENVLYYNYDGSKSFINTGQRFNDLISNSENIEYTTNFITKFKKDGHQLSIDGAFSQDKDNDFSGIEGTILETNTFVSSENTKKVNKQNRNLIQADYVLPIGKNSRLEAGFRGNYVDLLADYQVQERATPTSPFTNITAFTNILAYKENVNAMYTQFGSKINKFSYLFGVRYENSNIEVNQLTSNIYKTKNYENFFPSAFLTYEVSENSNISLNYSKRINRPRDRFINPFASYTSNINLFQGNPDINPALSDAYDLGYLKKWDKVTLSTSAYFNHTTNSFQVVRKERGDFINGVPVIINTPFNLAIEDKTGFEFTLNYAFKKWWKLNGNFNFFNSKTTGDYSYVNSANNLVVQNFDYNANTWFTRITSKITLPYKIEWQTNATYNAPQKYRQGTIKGIAAANVAFSKDVLKDMGTISFNVSDVFNSRKRIQDLQLPTVNSNSEMQWRQRQFTLSFTYRFNKKKTDKDNKPKQNENGEGENMG
ncbi:Outer membrane receptor proteins, mostly Fe transport [Flavobacterium swingsii]|uniref:Outer membrane receptor proteins, mostly Fe transport n=1 Tax=Flavobacterium swingsii TaxID=498292 RepID=A0A1I0ZL55_9FLAO|nr:outer membrane beta-barrel family protein [Flavobacterium swingsii]SFB26207.1 Outer membrane receptor proteins, mostly Fe transport [Flavobacterium swingsii]